MRIVPLPSPNFNARPAGVAIDMLVLHYTGMPDAASALRALTDGAAARQVAATPPGAVANRIPAEAGRQELGLAVALLTLAEGVEVSGSDRTESARLDRLRQQVKTDGRSQQ